MKNLQIPKGLFDIIPEDSREPWKEVAAWQYIEAIARQTASNFNFSEIRTPMFEKTELFTGSSGESSDIVTKEMYEFPDKAGRSMTLRPEGTAPVMRSFIEKRLYQEKKVNKLFYLAPMFRYGRQQAGRYRQHHQFGAECIGDGSAFRDAEIIDLLYSFYSNLGLKGLCLHINSVGDTECRNNYKKAFLDFLQPKIKSLSEYSRVRLEKNPLRILDSKEPEDHELVANAPSILDYLGKDSLAHFKLTCSLLEELKIPFEVNHKLVRGLDYYCRTVFEFVSGDLGAQNTIGGGGRYDKLIENLGGPSTPSVGFGTGLERIIQAMISQNINLPTPHSPTICLVCMGDKASSFGFNCLKNLRKNNITSEAFFHVLKLKSALKEVDKYKPRFRVIIGEDEVDNQEFEVTSLGDKKTFRIKPEDLPQFIKKNYLTSNPS
jgi:histidyl-tRNA synthetase